MAELFGFKFERIKDSDSTEKFTQPSADDGTVEIAGGGHYATVLDQDGRDRSEYDLIKRYRDISQQPECDSAIEDIVNEAIVSNERDQSVNIVLDQLPYRKNVKVFITVIKMSRHGTGSDRYSYNDYSQQRL